MINKVFGKTLIIVIIILFTGLSVASAVNGYNFEKNLIQNNFVKSISHNNTIRIFCDEDDHCLYYYNGEGQDYSIGHNATSAQGIDPDGDVDMCLGQYKDGDIWKFYRYFTYFNTSVIPDDATILDIQFNFFCCLHIGDDYPDPILMAFYDPSGTYPNKPLDLSDFNLNKYMDTNAGFFTVDCVCQKKWIWDPSSFNCINKYGWTKIMFITKADWDGDEPFIKDFFEMRGANYSSGEDPYNEPFLDITYNNPPSTPSITGPVKFISNENKEFNFSATDSDGDQIYYYIDWGDGTTSDWIGSYPSGYQLKLSHFWSEESQFTIRCKAKDIHNFESDWGSLNIVIPRSRIAINNLLQTFLENHPSFSHFFKNS